jgi:hypothetical protein
LTGSTPQNDAERMIAVLDSPSDSRSAASQAFIFIKKITIENATTETNLRMVSAPELREAMSVFWVAVEATLRHEPLDLAGHLRAGLVLTVSIAKIPTMVFHPANKHGECPAFQSGSPPKSNGRF